MSHRQRWRGEDSGLLVGVGTLSIDEIRAGKKVKGRRERYLEIKNQESAVGCGLHCECG